MGSWFSNLHVRKNSILTETDVIAYIRKIMTAQQYMPVESEDEADGAYAIISDNKSQWFSVYSDLFPFDETKQFDDYATPMSAELKTDILGIFDYDNLQLKQLIDVIATHVLTDDNAKLCNVYHSCLPSDKDCTKVYVMPKDTFPKWLLLYETTEKLV